MSVISHAAIDPKRLREAFGHFPSGVAALAAVVDGQRHVIVASSFTVGVSLDPPLVAVFVQKSSSTWTSLSAARRIGISVLSVDHAQKCRQLSGRDKSTRFNDIEAISTPKDAVRIEGAAAWFECSIFDIHAAGDHDVVLLLIHEFEVEKDTPPLVFHGSRFTQLAAEPAAELINA
ncbi:flavin reductase family protein [Bradyrhizobium ganzhouense]|uniref:flavin reductase family protein n=1 Tax=Bradyrhizobium ganzhouense TaxID=1179767 RepID=UPI003CF3F44C